jgi:hypothetical protein
MEMVIWLKKKWLSQVSQIDQNLTAKLQRNWLYLVSINNPLEEYCLILKSQLTTDGDDCICKNLEPELETSKDGGNSMRNLKKI